MSKEINNLAGLHIFALPFSNIKNKIINLPSCSLARVIKKMLLKSSYLILLLHTLYWLKKVSLLITWKQWKWDCHKQFSQLKWSTSKDWHKARDWLHIKQQVLKRIAFKVGAGENCVVSVWLAYSSLWHWRLISSTKLPFECLAFSLPWSTHRNLQGKTERAQAVFL